MGFIYINKPNDIYAYKQIDENRGYYSELEVVDCLYNTMLTRG